MNSRYSTLFLRAFNFFFFSFFVLSNASYAATDPKDPYCFGKKVCGCDQTPGNIAGYVSYDLLKKDLKVGQKVVVKGDDGYYFGFVGKKDEEKHTVSIMTGQEADKFKTITLNESSLVLYCHLLWQGSHGIAPTVFDDKKVYSWFHALLCKQLSETVSPLDPTYFDRIAGQFIEASLQALPGLTNESEKFPKKLFVQKLELASESRVFFWGDLHGDIASLQTSLGTLWAGGYVDDNFKLKPNIYIVGLGDYGDRCKAGVEVLYTLFRLKIANPHQVILVRGNHDEECMNEYYGLGSELKGKLHKDEEERKAVYQLYNLLPVALYLKGHNADGTSKTMLCCHGGPEIGYSAKDFLASDRQIEFIESLNRNDGIKKLGLSGDKLKIRLYDSDDEPDDLSLIAAKEYEPETIQAFVRFLKFSKPTVKKMGEAFGFLWNDFCKEKGVIFDSQRGLCLGEDVVKKICEQDGIDYIVRGHQHGDFCEELEKGHGFCSLFGGLVTTLLSGNLTKEKFFEFSMGRWHYDDGAWKLTHLSDNGPVDLAS